MTISTITSQRDVATAGLPATLQPNPFVTDSAYVKWSDASQPVNNVQGGATVWCKPDMVLNEMTESLNQKLAGLANPKTFVQPMISMPIFDNDLWRGTDFMVPQGINDQRRQELWQNGYVVNECSGPPTVTYATGYEHIREGYMDRPRRARGERSPAYRPPTTATAPNYSYDEATEDEDVREDFTFASDIPMQVNQCLTSPHLADANMYPNNSRQDVWRDGPNPHDISQPFLTEFGYYPENARYGLPTNEPAGRCEARPEMAGYNRNVYTSVLQPGVYSTSQVNQPDSAMANMGISYTQPMLPTYSSFVQRRDGVAADGVLYTQYDPNLAPASVCTKRMEDGGSNVPQETIYDPRFTGYGTAYRGYVDELTGRPKFYYDDIDVHRRNKFITRNKIDFEMFGLQNGAQDPSKFTNMQVRELAQNSYLDNQLSYRTELQQRLMQKNTNREWQQKKAPLVKNQFTRGGSSSAHGVASTGYAGPRG